MQKSHNNPVSPADILIARLDGVRRTGEGRWIARCPAHDDRHPSLAICEADDGRVLIRCFSGCGAAEIMAAAGLEMSDLFPPRTTNHRYAKERKPIRADDVLQCLRRESTIILLAAADILSGSPIDQDDRARIEMAANRINAGLTAAGIGYAQKIKI